MLCDICRKAAGRQVRVTEVVWPDLNGDAFLRHGQYGTLTFRRQYTSMFDTANFGPLSFSVVARGLHIGYCKIPLAYAQEPC